MLTLIMNCSDILKRVSSGGTGRYTQSKGKANDLLFAYLTLTI